MVDRTVTIDVDPATRRVIDRIKARWGPDAVRKEALRFFEKEALRTAGRVSRSISAGGKLKRRTGLLAKSITGVGLLLGGAPALRIGVFEGPSLAYAGVQEYGTKGKAPDSPYPTIRPGRNISRVTGRPTKALAMPVGPALTRAGVSRQVSPVDYPEELRFLRVNRGKVVGLLVTERSLRRGFRRAGKTGGSLRDQNLKVAFILLRLADIAPKHYLRDGFLQALPETSRRLGEHLASYLGGR